MCEKPLGDILFQCSNGHLFHKKDIASIKTVFNREGHPYHKTYCDDCGNESYDNGFFGISRLAGKTNIFLV